MTRAGLIRDELRFLRTWIANPRAIGAVAPSSRALAALMVERAHPDRFGLTLELGPGTGMFTQALLDAGIPPERIVAVEHSGEFCGLLRSRFPGVNIVHGDAFDLGGSLGLFAGEKFSAVLSGLPLLSFPKAARYVFVEGALDRLATGAVMAQFSYGLAGPIEPVPGQIAVERSRWVFRNLPPARVWTYSRP